MFGVAALPFAVLHFGLCRRRKLVHDGAAASLLSSVGVPRSSTAPQPATDARIAQIISEIPKRRVRQHFAP
jgi:hypothetical protein